jgi:5-methylcytosine-specific restriction endonuclease McrA
MVCFIDTVVRDWRCAPLYFLTRDDNGSVTENLFDGAHKLESLHSFVKGEYPINPTKDSSWKSSPLHSYAGMFWKDLPLPVQEKIRKYKFQVNYIPDEVANDPEALRVLWKRLNNAGTPLNGYELDIPVYGGMHRTLEAIAPNWVGSKIFTKEDSKRGQLEQKLYQLLSLSDTEWMLPSFSSLPDLAKKWRANMGSEIAKVEECIEKNKDKHLATLSKLRNILSDFDARGMFTNGDSDIDMSEHRLPLLIFLGRIGYWFQTSSKYNVHAEIIVKKLKSNVFLHSAEEFTTMMGCHNRNAKFQANVIDYIDKFLEPFSANNRRLFTLTERKLVLKNQKGLCATCKGKIVLESSEADHIVPYSAGGPTTIENCQVLHKHCHRSKGQAPTPPPS